MVVTKKNLIRFFTFIGGLYFFLEFFLPEEFFGVKLSQYNDGFSLSLRIIGAMAIGLGLINILMIHVPRVIFFKSNMLNSLALLLGMTLMFTVSVTDWYQQEKAIRPATHLSMLSAYATKLSNLEGGEQEAGWKLLKKSYHEHLPNLNLNSDRATADSFAQRELENEIRRIGEVVTGNLQNLEITKQFLLNLAQTLNIQAANWRQFLTLNYQRSFIYQFNQFLYEGLFVALSASMFSLLGFYVASAAYRAFRIRTLESGLMMLAAVIVMLGQIPFGIWLWEELPALRLWLLQVPNSAVFRGIALGVGVAGLIMAMRMWLSLESDYSAPENKK